MIHQRVGAEPQHGVPVDFGREAIQRQHNGHHVAVGREEGRRRARCGHGGVDALQQGLALIVRQGDIRLPADEPPSMDGCIRGGFCAGVARQQRRHRAAQGTLAFSRHKLLLHK